MVTPASCVNWSTKHPSVQIDGVFWCRQWNVMPSCKGSIVLWLQQMVTASLLPTDKEKKLLWFIQKPVLKKIIRWIKKKTSTNGKTECDFNRILSGHDQTTHWIYFISPYLPDTLFSFISSIQSQWSKCASLFVIHSFSLHLIVSSLQWDFNLSFFM